MEPTVLSVAQYLQYINDTLKQIPSSEMVVEGEVSDFRVAQKKWVSFDLKDEEAGAVLKCFMTVWQLKVELEDGMRVQVKGFPKIYERFGTFKMNVQEVSPVGEGALRRAYELLKKKLETEGLFDIARKRALRRFPERIGLITSRDAAAYGDFLRILNNRWGGVSVQHAHVHVQGRQAVDEIVGAFGYFNSLEDSPLPKGGQRGVACKPDVLVLTRGGGGLEDLHAFNDEQVARAVFGSSIPVVVAVGHERDESLADYVADVRASTPSNAVERVVPSRNDVLYEIETMARHMQDQIDNTISEKGRLIEHATNLVSFVLERQKERFRVIYDQLMVTTGDWLPLIRSDLEGLGKILRQVDPKRVLARGYSLVTVGGAVVTKASELEVGQDINVQFATGSADAQVKRVDGKGQQRLV